MSLSKLRDQVGNLLTVWGLRKPIIFFTVSWEDEEPKVKSPTKPFILSKIDWYCFVASKILLLMTHILSKVDSAKEKSVIVCKLIKQQERSFPKKYSQSSVVI